MFVSRLIAALFVLITAALIAIFTLLQDPTAGATRLPVELDLRPVELAAEPFDALSEVYLAAGGQEQQDFSGALAATREAISQELLALIRTELPLDLPADEVATLVGESVAQTVSLGEVRDLYQILVRGVPTQEATELEAARLAANPTARPTSVLTLSPQERRVIAFGDQVAELALATLRTLQSSGGPFAKALEEADKIEQVVAITARATRKARVATRAIPLEAFTPVSPTPASTQVERRTDVRARTGSTVAEILVDRGDDVAAGDVLLRLDPDDRPARRAQALAAIAQAEAGILQAGANLAAGEAGLAAAQAQVTQAETSLKDSQDALADTRTLVSGGARSANALRDAEVRVDQAEQSLLVAQAGLAQAEAAFAQSEAGQANAEAALLNAQAGLEQIDLDIERLAIKAPFAGRIEERFVELGDAVNPGEPVARVAELNTIKIVAQVADDLRQDLALNQSVEVSVGDDETRHSGHISFIGSTSGDLTRTFEVHVALPNPEDAAGKFTFADNQFATAYFRSPERMVYRIPQSSLSSASVANGDGSTGLRVVDANNRVTFIPLIQSDFAQGGDLLIERTRVDTDGDLRLIVGRAGFVEIGDEVLPREELQHDKAQ